MVKEIIGLIILKMENKKYRGFNTIWHLAHDFALSEFDFVDWDWLTQYKRPWSDQPRGPFIKDENKVLNYEAGKYDFALLHLDQQCLTDDILARGKGQVYRELNEVIKDVPKVVIMHGTPYYPEAFPNDIHNDTFAKNGISSELIKRCKDLVGDNTMVVNSHTAQQQWGFGETIIHGLSEEMWDLPKEPRVVTMISPGGLDAYYDRQLLNAVKEALHERGIELCHITVDFRPKDFDDYRKFLGTSLVYFNPTRESPMPRSRTEAMLSGCCVITTPNQDADEFIQDGVNGFLVKRNPEEVVAKILWCLDNYKEAVKIGQKGKETAKELFSPERYRQNWKELLEKVTNKKL